MCLAQQDHRSRCSVEYPTEELSLPNNRTHLNDFYDRRKDEYTESWTSGETPDGGRYGQDKPIYLLTSSHTFSAAEEFAYNLKNLKRATIVGQTTGGGAHPVYRHRINDRFALMVPFSRAISPITKTNWEGVGVIPHINVPASDALLTAQKLALETLTKKASTPDIVKDLRTALRCVERKLSSNDRGVFVTP